MTIPDFVAHNCGADASTNPSSHCLCTCCCLWHWIRAEEAVFQHPFVLLKPDPLELFQCLCLFQSWLQPELVGTCLYLCLKNTAPGACVCSGACSVPGQLPGGAAQGFGALRKSQIYSSRAIVSGVWSLTEQGDWMELVKLL